MTPIPRPHGHADSFYHLLGDTLEHRLCRGLACFAARSANTGRWEQARQAQPALHCLGKCYCGPAASEDDAMPVLRSCASNTVLLGNMLKGGATTLAAYRAGGGYRALAVALRARPEAIVEQLSASGLRGRGGAGFPTARKWRAVLQERAAHKYVIANADEGDAGAFSDRFLMELDPFRLIEAMTIAAHAVGAGVGYIYLRKEYPGARAVLERALAEARAAGLLGNAIMESALAFELAIVVGQGSYVCGEETALLNSIEGRRPEVRSRPPQITSAGLYGAPTLVGNVETLCNICWIVEHGAQAYAAMGAGQSRGTKLVSLGSVFQQPGLVEVDFGIPLRRIVEDIGGGLRSGPLKALLVGGPLAGLVPPTLLDTAFGYEEMHAIGAAVGHGGIIGFGADTSVAAIAEQVFRFGADESCGKCTPCHLGSPKLARNFESLLAGQGARLAYADFHTLVEALAQTSLCGHGRGLAEFASSLERHFHEELRACWP